MISKYFKELDGNSKEKLKKELGCDDNTLSELLGKLYEEGIIKVTGKGGRVLPVTNIGKPGSSCRFNFVGVIVIKGNVLKCYPKYFLGKPKNDDFRQVLEVIEEYKNRAKTEQESIKENFTEEIDDSSKSGSFNLLALMRWFLTDYYENGIYDNAREIIEVNGSGEILWEKTVNETVAVISKKRPYYMELLTKKRITDTYDYCKRLHEYILTEISRELKKEDLLDLFRLTEVELTDEKREDFGEDEYILYRIERELNTQFNTRKQMLLRNMYEYFSRKNSLYDKDCFAVYGTTSFNIVWEKVCAKIMENCLDLPLWKAAEERGFVLRSQWDRNKTLADLMEKVKLRREGLEGEESEKEEDSSNTESEEEEDSSNQEPEEEKSRLIPDSITIENIDGEMYFIILDAKYYIPKLKIDNGKTKTKGLPGIGDITKQYLYQLAYQPFIRDHGFKVKNCFLMPTEKEEVDSFGIFTLDMLKKLLQQMLGEYLLGALKEKADVGPYIQGKDELEDIQILRLPAKDAYDCYLKNKPYEIKKLGLK